MDILDAHLSQVMTGGLSNRGHWGLRSLANGETHVMGIIQIPTGTITARTLMRAVSSGTTGADLNDATTCFAKP